MALYTCKMLKYCPPDRAKRRSGRRVEPSKWRSNLYLSNLDDLSEPLPDSSASASTHLGAATHFEEDGRPQPKQRRWAHLLHGQIEEKTTDPYERAQPRQRRISPISAIIKGKDLAEHDLPPLPSFVCQRARSAKRRRTTDSPWVRSRASILLHEDNYPCAPASQPSQSASRAEVPEETSGGNQEQAVAIGDSGMEVSNHVTSIGTNYNF